METLVGIVILIVLAYLVLCLFLYVLRIVIGIIVLIAVPTSLYLFFVMDEHFYAILLFVGVCMLAELVDGDGDGQKKEEKKADYAYKAVEHKERRTSSSSNSSMNKALMYLIPIFWPYLILKAIFSEKQAKTDMSPYDYEQHLKSNGK